MKNIQRYLRLAISYAGVIEGVTNAVHVPVSVRTAIVTVSGVLMSIDHYLAHPDKKTAAAAATSVVNAVDAIRKEMPRPLP